jgi:DNA-binding MarR family transcriptional regulator
VTRDHLKAEALKVINRRFRRQGPRAMLLEASIMCIMRAPEPLSPDEEALWRAINRIMVALPRALDDDLIHATGLALNEYAVLMNLSEADNRELRMADLAAATVLSASRITRLIDGLRSRGLVTKRRSIDDGRGNVAALTDEGFAKLQAAYPDHLASARKRVIDHVSPANMQRLGRTLARVAETLND